MKKTLLCLAFALSRLLLVAAEPSPNEALSNAAKVLAEKPSYSWKTTVEIPGDPTGTIEGKLEKDGAVVLALARAEQSFSGVLKGGKAAIKTEDGWKTAADAADDTAETGAIRFVARILKSFKVPTEDATDLAAKAVDLKLADGVYSGTLPVEVVKELLLFRSRGGDNRPEISGAKGSIKFWVKDGSLAKYEYKVQGTLSLNGNDRDVDRTHTTEISEVGTTKATVPEGAAKLL